MPRSRDPGASAQVSGAMWIYPSRDGTVGGRRYVAATAPPHRLLPPSDPASRRRDRSYRAAVAGRALASVAAVALVTVFASAAAAAAGPAAPTTAFPAAGELTQAVAVRAAPAPSAPIVRRLQRFRPDQQFQIVLALASRRGRNGDLWYRLSLPGRPNGARGWVRADAVDVRPVVNRIVVRLGSRRLEVRRIRDGRLLLSRAVAIGAAGTTTPLGHDFYVQSAFVPTDPFFGTFALETTAYARVSDWPTSVVGIHGTNQPELLGQAVSHGCVRVANDVAARLRRLAPLGTPIDIVR
jgi:lipoprotein-anchoring transpeptidase ErfK/SrfK